MTREEAIKFLELDKKDRGKCIISDAIDMAIKALEREPCEDAISRQAVLELIDQQYPMLTGFKVPINELSPITPQQKIGRWIYDKEINNWRCSECGETPKTMGYCGSANFMAEHFKYCNHCGAKMESGDKV